MKHDALERPAITNELLLHVFDLPVSFHRCLVPITGGVTSALMLSQAIWISQGVEQSAEGWFARSQDQWTEETGLSRWEQETARRALRGAGFLEERRIGMPAKLWYRVRAESVWQALRANAERPVNEGERWIRRAPVRSTPGDFPRRAIRTANLPSSGPCWGGTSPFTAGSWT